MFANELVDITHRTTENIYTCYFFKSLQWMQKFANSIFSSVAYHDRMITMFGSLNHFSIEAEI